VTDPEKGVHCACLRSATVGRKAGERERERERVILICFHMIMMIGIRVMLCYAGNGCSFRARGLAPGVLVGDAAYGGFNVCIRALGFVRV
jgi:hypothetical protein